MTDDKQEINLHLINYPASEDSHAVIKEVVFGFGEEVTVLVQVDVASGDLTVTVGNGPEDERLNASLAGMFYELGEMFESLTAEEK